jgi:cytochrome b involved in lipid metabolism
MSGEKKVITLTELQEHNTAKSLWIAINNHVYDITKFLDEVGMYYMFYRY